MKSNIHTQPLTLRSIPSTWTDSEGRTIHGYQNRPDLHYVDGWRDYVEPGFDRLTQRLGDLVYDEAQDIVTRVVIDKTSEELEAERRAMAPMEIKPSQGKIMLHRMGLLEAVEQMVHNQGNKELELFWDNAQTWERDNIYIQSMAIGLAMNEDDKLNFFTEASKIN